MHSFTLSLREFFCFVFGFLFLFFTVFLPLFSLLPSKFLLFCLLWSVSHVGGFAQMSIDPWLFVFKEGPLLPENRLETLYEWLNHINQ